MSNLIFTICSINYLGQAITLGKSIRKTNPDYKFVVGLVDRIENRSEMLAGLDFEFIEMEKVGVTDFEGMCKRYTIVELNTAVKPYFAEYLMNKYPECNNFSYMDPDMKVFTALTPLEEQLSKNNIVLTPHMTSSPTIPKNVSEYGVLKVGIFNLGFIGMSRTDETLRFLKWWQDKLLHECIYDRQKNINVDQGWVTLAPCYFDGVLSWRHKGTNVAYWNIHDRPITKNESGKYFSGDDPLLFFHFSGYKPSSKNELKVGWTAVTFADRPDLEELFNDYYDELIQNKYFEFKKEKCLVPIKSKRRKPMKEVVKIRTIAVIDNLF